MPPEIGLTALSRGITPFSGEGLPLATGVTAHETRGCPLGKGVAPPEIGVTALSRAAAPPREAQASPPGGEAPIPAGTRAARTERAWRPPRSGSRPCREQPLPPERRKPPLPGEKPRSPGA